MKIVEVEVVGVEPPCPRCKETMDNVMNAASRLYKETGIIANINKVNISSKEAIEKYGVVMSPAVAVNGVVRVMGRVPSEGEVMEMLKNLSEQS